MRQRRLVQQTNILMEQVASFGSKLPLPVVDRTSAMKGHWIQRVSRD
jgi:hypothetical protein